jgi:hypothetical protein
MSFFVASVCPPALPGWSGRGPRLGVNDEVARRVQSGCPVTLGQATLQGGRWVAKARGHGWCALLGPGPTQSEEQALRLG